MTLIARSWLLSLIVVAGCGGSVATDSSGDAGGSAGENAGGQLGSGGSAHPGSGGTAGENAGGHSGSGGSVHPGSGGTTVVRVPTQHRAAVEVCDHTRPPIMPVPDGGTGYDIYCTSDSDCTEGENGRCENFRGSLECTYDECFSDSDCTAGGPCGCEKAFWSDANACLEGNCRTDADCGPAGYCSPTLSNCGNYSGVVGYYCHTPEDECTNDEDCGFSEDEGPGYCMYSPQVSHWICSYSQCVG